MQPALIGSLAFNLRFDQTKFFGSVTQVTLLDHEVSE